MPWLTSSKEKKIERETSPDHPIAVISAAGEIQEAARELLTLSANAGVNEFVQHASSKLRCFSPPRHLGQP